jgi:uncharacterized tellurite resistance protein B-like protein
MSFLSRFLGSSSQPSVSTDPESVQILLEKLAPLSEDKARELACFAYVLGRVASADQEITDSERRSVRGLLQEKGHLPLEQAELVAEVALNEARHKGGTQDYLVTRKLREMLPVARREEILDCLLAVAAADGVIVASEEDELKQIAMQLGFEKPAFFEALGRYREYRSVLKGMGP